MCDPRQRGMPLRKAKWNRIYPLGVGVGRSRSSHMQGIEQYLLSYAHLGTMSRCKVKRNFDQLSINTVWAKVSNSEIFGKPYCPKLNGIVSGG